MSFGTKTDPGLRSPTSPTAKRRVIVSCRDVRDRIRPSRCHMDEGCSWLKQALAMNNSKDAYMNDSETTPKSKTGAVQFAWSNCHPPQLDDTLLRAQVAVGEKDRHLSPTIHGISWDWNICLH